MGINMDIRNEPEYEFLDLGDLDDVAKNEILAILRPNSGLDSLKLPWDIGEKEYEITSEIVENPVEEHTDNQWQQYGITDGISSYEGCGVPSTPMMPPGIPTHPFAGHHVMYVREFSGIGNPYGNSAAGDPNTYSYVSGIPYPGPQPMYPSGSELMSQPPTRENDRRSRGRGGSGGGGKRESYNRMMNVNNDVQTGFIVQGQPQYSQMVPMCHTSGTLYTAQPHPAAGPPIYLQTPASNYPQGPQMHHSNHAPYCHHPLPYQAHPHSPNSNKYPRGNPNQTTYYNQDNTKNALAKHHEKRSYQLEAPTNTPPFRHRSNSNNNNDDESSKENYLIDLIVNNSTSSVEMKNAIQITAPKSTDIAKKVPLSVDHVKVDPTEVERIKEDNNEIVDKKENIHAGNIDNNNVNVGVKDKLAGNEKEVSYVQEKISSPTSIIESPPKTKTVESAIEPNDVATTSTKYTQEEVSKIPETQSVTPATIITTSVSSAPPISTTTFANVLKKRGPPGGDSVKSPPPITKLPVARVPSISFPPPPAESTPIPKVLSQDVPRNENPVSTAVRNNVEVTSKPAENSAWSETKVPTEVSQQNHLKDPAIFRMGELLLKYQMDKQTVSLQPRGLTNRNNYCYINSILQALLACGPFYNLLMALPYPRNTMKNSSTPLIDNMVRFVRDFNPLAEGARMPRKDRSQKRGEETTVDVQCGVAFEPSYVYTMLKNTSCAGVFSVEGRQEDAEEFLSCLLNGISDEMLELMKLVNSESSDTASNTAESNVNFSNAEEGWKVMGPKNKGSITRCTEFGRTPLSDIFRGQLRSRVLRTGDETTDNVQPFFTLQLDIEKAESVEGALEILVGKDQVEGMTCSKTKQQIEAWKQVLLEELPVILILHLKWFDYKLDGCSKILKRVGFPIDLKLDGKLLSPNVAKKLVRKQRHYKLFAVTYHDGKEASKGHYVTDAFHVGYNAWVRYDDSSVKGIYEMDVLNPTPPRVPYLLYYRRCDTIGNNSVTTARTR